MGLFCAPQDGGAWYVVPLEPAFVAAQTAENAVRFAETPRPPLNHAGRLASPPSTRNRFAKPPENVVVCEPPSHALFCEPPENTVFCETRV